MRIAVGIVCTAMWLIWAGQLVSWIDFPLAQRLGLQEKPDEADPLSSKLELGTARWDVLWLWTLPVAGVLMLLDHSWWPYAALIGGGTYIDTGGREAVKAIGLRTGGVRAGTAHDVRIALGLFAFFIVLGAVAIAVALAEVT